MEEEDAKAQKPLAEKAAQPTPMRATEKAGAQAAAQPEKTQGIAARPVEKTAQAVSVRPTAQGATEEKSIASRGIPSSECLYLPAHDSPSLRSFEDQNGAQTRNLWGMEEIMNFVFPSKYQRKYNEVAVAFMREMVKKTKMEGAQIADFISSCNISKATFYNRVLPRLKRVGMLKVERQTLIAVESRRKYRPMTIHLSKTFGNYLVKIGDSWLACVDEARSVSKQAARAP